MPNQQPFHQQLTKPLETRDSSISSLSLSLFAMVNNDAWLTNSSLEGAFISEPIELLLAIVATMQTDEPEIQSLKKLTKLLQQMNNNEAQIEEVIDKGNKLRDTPKKKKSSPDPWSQRNAYWDAPEPEQRFDSGESLIQSLAKKFSTTISSLSSNESFYLPGGFWRHAVLFEFKRIENELVFMIYNTGNGLEYHEVKTVTKHGVIKEKKFPVIAYTLPFEESKQPEFSHYIAELLKARIASTWTPNAEEKIPFAYPRSAQEVYTKILPLIAHLQGKKIDPKSVCAHPVFITGQRSGKCSEAVFHPLLRNILGDETLYQRFMLTYRKLTISRFIQNADLQNLMVRRQIQLAATNLAARTYKQSATLTSDEFVAMTTFTELVIFIVETNPIRQTQPDESVNLTLTQTTLPQPREMDPLKAITLSTKGSLPTLIEKPSLSCNVDVTNIQTLDKLLEKMNQLEQWITETSSRPEISPKEIVVAIEQFFFTYPIRLLSEQCDQVQRDSLAVHIQTVMEHYIKYYLKQIGVNSQGLASILTARKVVTIWSALALMTTANDSSVMTFALRTLFVNEISKLIEINQFNPYLTSMSYICDQRIKELSNLKQMFSSSTLEGKSLYDIYAAVITADQAQKDILLSIFSKVVLPDLKKFNITSIEAKTLTQNNQCLFVVLNAYLQLPTEAQERISLSRQNATMLTHYIQIFQLTRELSVDSNSSTRTSTREEALKKIRLYSSKSTIHTIEWVFDTPFRFLGNINTPSLLAAQKPIKNTKIKDFLKLDINSNLSRTSDPFRSSTIQAKAAEHPPELTEEEFLFSQFCHTRTATSCQVTATLEFIQANPALLEETDWQTVITLNLFQPSMLLDAFERNPTLQEDCELLLIKLSAINTKNGHPNRVGLFCIRLQAMINAYLVDSKPELSTKAAIHLEKINNTLEEMLQQHQNQTLQPELYQLQSHVISQLIKHQTNVDQELSFLKSYLTAKLFGSKISLMNLKDTPDEFVQQEIEIVSMQFFLLKHADWVKNSCVLLLKERLSLSCKQDSAPQFQYPSVFITLADGIVAVINLETGQILKNGKEYGLLPNQLLASDTFNALTNNSVNMGWVSMEPGEIIPGTFEIDNPTRFIQRTREGGYIFQQDLPMLDGSLKRCQLTPSEQLKMFNETLPKTLLDSQHRFWVTIDKPTQVIIEETSTKTMIYHAGPSANGKSLQITALHDQDYQLLSQADLVANNLSNLLGDFEDPQFISVEKYIGDDLNKPRALISLDRYGLRFAIRATTPLTIDCLTEPKGTLRLTTKKQQRAGLQNLLLIDTEKNTVALLPRQYFIHDTNADTQCFEYKPLCLDTRQQHLNFVLKDNPITHNTYCNQSEMVTVKAHTPKDDSELIVDQMTLLPEDGASALYLAYSYLANFDPYAALDALKYCEQQGGLIGTQRELEHLMLLFNGLPAQVDKEENVNLKRIMNPEFIAVRTFALYLYAERQHHNRLQPTKISDKKEAQVFTQDTAEFQKNINITVEKVIGQYFTDKHNVPVSMQLNTQQEAACLRITSRKSLLGITYQYVQHQALNETDPEIEIHDGCEYEKTEEIKLTDLYNISDSDTLNIILAQISKQIPTGQFGIGYLNDWTNPDALLNATEQLSLSLPIEKFLENFPTYFYIAINPTEPSYSDARKRLNLFLTQKMHILGLGGDVYAADLLVPLYIILNNPERTNLSMFKDATTRTYGFYALALVTFDKFDFYNALQQWVKKQSLTITIPDACPNRKTKLLLSQLLASEPQSPFIAIAQQETETLSYPSTQNPLATLELPSLEQILTEIGEDFVKKVADFQSLFTQHQTTQLTQKAVYATQLAKKSFVEAAAETLRAERHLGAQYHKNIQTEIECAIPLFSDAKQYLLLQELVARTSIDANTQVNHSRMKMLEFARSCTLPTLENPINIAQTAKLKPVINEALLITLFLEGSPQHFMEMTGLNAQQTQKLHQFIANYLFVSTYQQQLKKIGKAFDDLQNKPKTELEQGFAFRSLALQLTTPNSINLTTDSPALTVFQFAMGTLLKPEQVSYLRAQLATTNGQFNNNLSQLIMGFGKTFLLPILAKAKATGNNLSVIEVPKELFATNLANFTQASLHIFNQKPNSFCFDRETNCSSQALADLYDRLMSIQTGRDYLVTTGESVASLNLRHKELLKQLDEQQTRDENTNPSKNAQAQNQEQTNLALFELRNQVYWIGELVKLFKYRADAIIDEVHAGLNIRKKLIYSIGTKPIDQHEIDSILDLYQFLLPIISFQELRVQDIIENPGVVPPTQWPDIIKKLIEQLINHKASPIRTIAHKLSDDQQQRLNRYLQSKLEDGDHEAITHLFASTQLSRSEKDVLALYKTEFTSLLPATLSKQNRRHYGLLLEEAQIMRSPCAVPFIASDTPNIIGTKGDQVQTTHFANPDETVNYTIQAYMVQGLPKTMVKQIIHRLKERAILEFIRDNAANYATTETGQLFAQMTQPLNLQSKTLQHCTLDNPHIEDNAQLVEALMRSQPFIFYALQHEILPNVLMDNATLEMNATQRAYLYRSVQGIAGTIDNHHSISQRLPLDRLQAIGTNGITIELINTKSTVFVFDAQPHTPTIELVMPTPDQPATNVDTGTHPSLVKTLFSNDRPETRVHAFIDAGGLFTGMTNLKVAQEIAAELRNKLSDDPRKFVLFLNASNELSAINKEKPDQVIFIGSSDEKTIIGKLGNSNTATNWVTYFDQSHTVGMDIPQAQQAVAAITIAYDGTLSAFLQAAMRMRDLPKKQTLHIYMDQTVAAYCSPDNGQPTPEQVITFLSNNETHYLSEDHLRYILAEMDNTLYQELEEYLLTPCSNQTESTDINTTIDHQVQMFKVIQDHTDIFIKTNALGLFERYGHLETEGRLLDLLAEKKKRLLMLRADILKNLNLVIDTAANTKFEDKLNACIQLAEQTCKPTIVSKNLSEEGNQLEAETETETETAVNAQLQAEQQTEVSIQNITERGTREPTVYQEWLCSALKLRDDESAWECAYQRHCLSLATMLETTVFYPPQLQLNPNLWISNNHAKMTTKQNALFNFSKMPFKYTMMRSHAGKLTTFLITPHEVEVLLKKHSSVFSEQPPNAVFWIESFPSGRIIIGKIPTEVSTALNYLEIKEQLKFMNGDIQSLLLQKDYIWLPRHLETKRTLLPTLLSSRPDQKRYATPLLARVGAIMHQYEDEALDALAKRDANSKGGFMFKVADMICPAAPASTEAQEEQCIAASKLIARLHTTNLLTATYLAEVYPQLTPNQSQLLAQLYHLKKLLRQQQTTPMTTQLSAARNALENAPLPLICQVLTQATTEGDRHLIDACYSQKTQLTTEILNSFPIDENHPILSSLQHHSYSLCVTLLKNHFRPTTQDSDAETTPWLEPAFKIAYEKNDIKALSLLLDHCGTRLPLSLKSASDCVALFAQFEKPELTQTLLTKMENLSYINELRELDKSCKKLVEIMRAITSYSYRKQDEQDKIPYLLQYPNFTLQEEGYSQLMLACKMEDLSITQQIFPNTRPNNRAQETRVFQYSAITIALQGKNTDLLHYLFSFVTPDFYCQLSLANAKLLVKSLSDKIRVFDDKQASTILTLLIKHCPDGVLVNNDIRALLLNLFSNLTIENKLEAAQILYDYCHSQQIIFSDGFGLGLMQTILKQRDCPEEKTRFLLNKFPTCILEGSPAPFVIGYPNLTTRKIFWPIVQEIKPRTLITANLYESLSSVIATSLIYPPKEQREQNIKDALTIIESVNNTNFGCALMKACIQKSHYMDADNLPLDIYDYLSQHYDLSSLLSEWLNYLTSPGFPSLEHSKEKIARLNTICGRLIPKEPREKTRIIKSALFPFTKYCQKFPEAIEQFFSHIKEVLENIYIYKENGNWLFIYTLAHGPQCIVDELIKQGCQLTDPMDKKNSDSPSNLDELIRYTADMNLSAASMETIVTLLNQTILEPTIYEAYIKKAMSAKNPSLLEALLRCDHDKQKLQVQSNIDELNRYIGNDYSYAKQQKTVITAYKFGLGDIHQNQFLMALFKKNIYQVEDIYKPLLEELRSILPNNTVSTREAIVALKANEKDEPNATSSNKSPGN